MVRYCRDCFVPRNDEMCDTPKKTPVIANEAPVIANEVKQSQVLKDCFVPRNDEMDCFVPRNGGQVDW